MICVEINLDHNAIEWKSKMRAKVGAVIQETIQCSVGCVTDLKSNHGKTKYIAFFRQRSRNWLGDVVIVIVQFLILRNRQELGRQPSDGPGEYSGIPAMVNNFRTTKITQSSNTVIINEDIMLGVR
jgi:predicted neuraminidase